MHGLCQMYLGHGNRFWHTRMVLLGNVCQVEACFGPFRDCVSLRARYVHGFAPNVPRKWKSFWAQPMVLLGNGGQEEACFNPFGDTVNLIAR